MEGSNTPAASEQPTMEQIKAIADAAAKDAAEAKSIAEAKQNVQTSVETEAEKQGVDLSEEDAKKIANMLITQLDAMGAIPKEDEPASPEPQNPPTNAVPADVNSAPPANAEPPSAPAAPVADTSPAKKTWAERFMGK